MFWRSSTMSTALGQQCQRCMRMVHGVAPQTGQIAAILLRNQPFVVQTPGGDSIYTSIGESLAQHPASMAQSFYTPEERKAHMISEGLVWISASSLSGFLGKPSQMGFTLRN
ncbi:MAG: hypothetical protein IPP03_04785 [Dechloromonas sp.]|nr:hypothetical protein [Candidatus Dechloromonas phosphoritropha]